MHADFITPPRPDKQLQIIMSLDDGDSLRAMLRTVIATCRNPNDSRIATALLGTINLAK